MVCPVTCRFHGKLHPRQSTLRHMGAEVAQGLQHKHHSKLPLTPSSKLMTGQISQGRPVDSSERRRFLITRKAYDACPCGRIIPFLLPLVLLYSRLDCDLTLHYAVYLGRILEPTACFTRSNGTFCPVQCAIFWYCTIVEMFKSTCFQAFSGVIGVTQESVYWTFDCIVQFCLDALQWRLSTLSGVFWCVVENPTCFFGGTSSQHGTNGRCRGDWGGAKICSSQPK